MSTCIYSYAQTESSSYRPITSGTTEIYDFVETAPQFPGGDAALKQWISDNFNFKATENALKSQQRAYVRFEILKDGRVVNPQIIKGINPEVDQALIKTIENMPKWRPGEMRNKKVIVRYVLPIDLSF